MGNIFLQMLYVSLQVLNHANYTNTYMNMSFVFPAYYYSNSYASLHCRTGTAPKYMLGMPESTCTPSPCWHDATHIPPYTHVPTGTIGWHPLDLHEIKLVALERTACQLAWCSRVTPLDQALDAREHSKHGTSGGTSAMHV